MSITSENVKKALNDFRDLMKPCFIDPNSFTDVKVNIGSGIEIPPTIQAYDSTNKITGSGLDVNLDIYDSIQIDKITQATYDKIQINNTSNVLTPIKDYIPYNKYTLEDIRKAVDSDPSVLLIKREYLTFLIYHYIQLIILSAVAIKITDNTTITKETVLYKSYIKYINNHIREINDIDIYKPIKNYKTNIGKIQVSNNKFLEQKTYNKKIINEIEDNERHLDYLYLYIYFIITLLIVIILFCILFKNKNNYLISVLVLLILINAYFSKNVVLIEGFNTQDVHIEVIAKKSATSPTVCSVHLDLSSKNKSEIKYKLCQVFQVTYNKFENNSIDSTELIRENKLYDGLYNKAKNINLNTKDKINIDTFSFYRRKAYTNLFMRIVILAVLLLILYNIFGYNYIIVILGIVLFCLILMVYFYTLKHMSRTNYRTKNWI